VHENAILREMGAKNFTAGHEALSLFTGKGLKLTLWLHNSEGIVQRFAMKWFARSKSAPAPASAVEAIASAAGEGAISLQLGKMLPAGAVDEAWMEARVIRCACGAPAEHTGAVCPQGVEDAAGFRKGYYNADPAKIEQWESARGH
jgi:hypothetical protein